MPMLAYLLFQFTEITVLKILPCKKNLPAPPRQEIDHKCCYK